MTSPHEQALAGGLPSVEGLVAEFETGRFATWLQALNWCARAAEALRSFSAKLAAVERERDAFSAALATACGRWMVAEAKVKALTERLAEREARLEESAGFATDDAARAELAKLRQGRKMDNRQSPDRFEAFQSTIDPGVWYVGDEHVAYLRTEVGVGNPRHIAEQAAAGLNATHPAPADERPAVAVEADRAKDDQYWSVVEQQANPEGDNARLREALRKAQEAMRYVFMTCPVPNATDQRRAWGSLCDAIQSADAALTAEPQAAPKGMVLVPRIPTWEMEAACHAVDLPSPDIYGDFSSLDKERAGRDLYDAMLAASPAVQGGE